MANARGAVEMVLAGIRSAIPVDEAILVMKRLGNATHTSIKETAEGGLAATSTAQKLLRQVFGAQKTFVPL